MCFVLRFALIGLVFLALTACSKTPPDTLLRSSKRAAPVVEGVSAPRKTMSSDILYAIAMERVTGRPMSSRPKLSAVSRFDGAGRN